MGKLFLICLMFQLSLLTGLSLGLASNHEINQIDSNTNFNNQTETNEFLDKNNYNLPLESNLKPNWQKRFISYLSDPERKTMLAITIGLNLNYLHFSTDDYNYYNNHDSFEKVIYGPNFGLSIIRRLFKSSHSNGRIGEIEVGVFFI